MWNKMKRKYSNRNWKSYKSTRIEFELQSTFRFENENENEIEYLKIISFNLFMKCEMWNETIKMKEPFQKKLEISQSYENWIWVKINFQVWEWKWEWNRIFEDYFILFMKCEMWNAIKWRKYSNRSWKSYKSTKIELG